MSEKLSGPGYALTLPLPPGIDDNLRRWAGRTPGATWDEAGGHVTVARLTGSIDSARLMASVAAACERIEPFPVRLDHPVRDTYWDKPGLEIVMLVGSTPDDTAGVMRLRDLLLETVADSGLELLEAGDYRPHLTLTTGLPPEEAAQLVAAANQIEVTFTAREVLLWAGNQPDEAGQPRFEWLLSGRYELSDGAANRPAPGEAST